MEEPSDSTSRHEENPEADSGALSTLTNNQREAVEANLKPTSREQEKGSGKGKLPEHRQQQQVPTSASFQKTIVTLNSTSTPTKTQIVRQCDNKEAENSILEGSTKADESSDNYSSKDIDPDGKPDNTSWDTNIDDKELVVVVVEKDNEPPHLQLHIEDDTASNISSPTKGNTIDCRIPPTKL